MTGLRRRHGNADGVQISHLTEHNDIRCLAQAGTQSGHIAVSIGRKLALADDTLDVTMQILNRIFNRNDMCADDTR